VVMDGTREHRQRYRTDSPEIEGARFGKAGSGALEDVFEC
jgi:hypothetical protein